MASKTKGQRSVLPTGGRRSPTRNSAPPSSSPPQPPSSTIPGPGVSFDPGDGEKLKGVTDGTWRKFGEMVTNMMMSRAELMQSTMFDSRKNIYDACNLPAVGQLTEQMFWDMYDREPLAARVVEVLPKESWQTQPTVYEDKDNENVTPFEDAWDALGQQLRGESSWYQDEEGNPVWEYLLRADILSGIGQYGVIFLGLDDSDDLTQPANFVNKGGVKTPKRPEPARKPPVIPTKGAVGGAQPPGQTPGSPLANIGNAPPPLPLRGAMAAASPSGNGKPKTGPRKLLYMRVLPQRYAKIAEFDNDPKSARNGQPLFYDLTFADPRGNFEGVNAPTKSVRVHWTRIIHVADGLLGNEVFGTERQRKVWNCLVGLQKLYCSSPEMYWRGAFPGIALSSIPQLGADAVIDVESLRKMMYQYAEDLQRWFAVKGLNVQQMNTQVVDPSPQINVLIEAICIFFGIPVRVFKGSERGELASSQDDAAWNDRLKLRQKYYITPRIIVPFVDRLISVGVLPQPSGYSVYWTDLTSLTETEKAALATARTDALVKFIGGNGEAMITPLDFLVTWMGLPEDEAMTMLENAAAAIEAKMEQEMKMQEDLIARGLIPDPTAPPPPPPGLDGNNPPDGGGGGNGGGGDNPPPPNDQGGAGKGGQFPPKKGKNPFPPRA